MTRKTRLALALALAAAVALVVVPSALAAAGGGSAGFGGGGGGGGFGGGGGGGGHGKSFAIYLIFRVLLDIAIWGHGLGLLILLGLAALFVIYAYGLPRIRAWLAAQRTQGRRAGKTYAKRERRTELAAAEASEENESFSPEVVRTQAAKLFTDIQSAWDQDDRIRLRGLVAPELLDEWERRLDDFVRKGWRNHVQVLEPPHVEMVGLTNRTPGQERVVVRIEAKLKDVVVDYYGRHIKRSGRLTETVRTRELWTLALRSGQWILASIEQGAEGAHVLGEQLVATPWSDEQGMRDEALIEGAIADAVPEGTKVAEVADLNYEGDAHAAAMDLSVADARFNPDVLEVAARRAVAAWVEAVDGNDAQLRAIARPQAVKDLLHPGDASGQTRVVVRGLTVKRITITALDAQQEPPTMIVDVALNGRRYIEDRSSAAVLAGSKSKATDFTERWMLALEGPDAEPWKVAAVATAVRR